MRIFIDCTLVDFSRQPTGIPRVVLNYINVGYRWAADKKDIEIIPCVPSQEGMYICRPVPGQNPPDYLTERAIKSELESRPPRSVVALQKIAGYLAGVSTSLIGVVSAVLPTDSTKALHREAHSTLSTAVNNMRSSWADAAKRQILLTPGKGDIIFCPAYWHDVDPTIYRKMRQNGAKIIILVHDILPISHDKYYPSPWKYEFKNSVTQTASYATALYTVSNYTRDCVREFLMRQRVVLPRIQTAYNGFEPLVSDEGLELIKSTTIHTNFGNPTITKLARERHPYVMVGSVEPKKGHIPTVQCFEMMWDAGLERELVIVGRKGWMDSEITRTIEGSRFYGTKLFWFSNIDDFDLADLYVHCHALIFSSLAEGFGIPMIEAGHYGAPAIVFESPIAREVIGKYGTFFDDAAGLIEQIEVFETEEGYNLAKDRLKDFKWHSWEEYSPAVFDAMVELSKEV